MKGSGSVAVPQGGLRTRRDALVQAWAGFFHAGVDPADLVPAEIAESWRRTRGAAGELAQRQTALTQEVVAVPDPALGARLGECGRRLDGELREVAGDSGFLVALAAPDAHLVSVHAGPNMSRAAGRLNAVDGSVWSEKSMGANAVALALGCGRPVEVFTAQHANEALHGWTCWATPIRDLRTGVVLGALDVSAPWRHHGGAGRAITRALSALIEARLGEVPPLEPTRVLGLRLFGGAEVELDGRMLQLSPRQVEILAVLALRPEGANLQRLHADLYGERPITAVTLRAELSKLRGQLGAGVLTRHPYRLGCDVRCDLVQQRRHIAAGRLTDALGLQRGEALSWTEAPFLRAARDQAQVALRTAVLAAGRTTDLLRYLEVFPDDGEVLERAHARAASGTPEHAVLAGWAYGADRDPL